MRKFRLYGTKYDPYVYGCDGHMELVGRATEYTENIKLLYKWLLKYEGDNILFKIKLDYMASHPKHTLMSIFKKLQEYHDEGKKVKVYWIYEHDDEDNKEDGEDMQRLYRIDFQVLIDKNYLREIKLKRILLDDV